MNTKRQLAATGAVAVLALALAACGSGENSGQTGSPAPSSAAAQTSQQAMGSGMTTAKDVFGPACAQVPTTGEGSVAGMVDDPVGTAASNNPLLTKLVTAVKAAGLVDTLNKSDAQYTVFAPADPAFDAIPKNQLQSLLTDAAQKPKLTGILTYHVVAKRLDAKGITAAQSLDTVQGGRLTVAGTADAPTVNGAKVLCGNIPTANATVFVIDKVLMPQ